MKEQTYPIKSTDWADIGSIGEWGGREEEVVEKYNAMLEMLAKLIPEYDDDSWYRATHHLWDLVGSDEELPDYTDEQMTEAVNKAS